MLPVDALKKHGQLSRSKVNLSIAGDRPDEAAPLQAFGEEAQSVTVSPPHFYLVTPTSAKDKQVSGERVILQDDLTQQ